MESDPFWFLLLMAMLFGLAFTLFVCGLWEMARAIRTPWRPSRPRVYRKGNPR